jgi:hypothetical protein
MKIILCNGCNKEFESETFDHRPFVYHECLPGIYFGHRNPNFFNAEEERMKRLYESKKRMRTKKMK